MVRHFVERHSRAMHLLQVRVASCNCQRFDGGRCDWCKLAWKLIEETLADLGAGAAAEAKP
jgi:hypothetical protein